MPRAVFVWRYDKTGGISPVPRMATRARHHQLARQTDKFQTVICQEASQRTLIFHRWTLLFRLLYPAYQIVETGDIITHLNLKLTFAIEPFNKETFLFLVNSDTFHPDLVEYLTNCM